LRLSLYDVCRCPVGLLLSILCHQEVKNRPVDLPEGPLIIVANHLSWFDIPLLAVAIPRRRIAFMAKKEYFHSPVHAFLLRIFGGFTVDRGTVDRTALNLATEALKDNSCALGIFPEGTRSRTLQLQRGKLGAAYIALRGNASILPIGISGTEKIRQKYEHKTKLFHRPKVTINLGEPFRLPEVKGNPTRKDLASSTETIMRRIAELLPESYRGVYRDNGN